MVVPLAGRWVAAACGILLVLAGWQSVIGTLIVPRPVGSWLTRWADRIVITVYRAGTRRVTDYRRRDRILATQAAAILVTQLAAWLLIFLAGFTLVLWPSHGRGITAALTEAGSSLFTLGFAEPPGTTPDALVFVAAATGMIVVALQVGYLPALYGAFNRRETEVALLVSRAGVPSWGPELLARQFYALGSGVSTLNTLPDLYRDWERWSADIAESHTTYLPLVRFRSPQPFSSWVISLLAMLDSAALILALAPDEAPTVPARLFLRSGFGCLSRIARAMGIDVPEEADPEGGITLTYEEFLGAIARMKEVSFPISREPADAWLDFVGWRVNYESAAYQIAAAVDAVPALWSGPRHFPMTEVAPQRPPSGRQRPDSRTTGTSPTGTSPTGTSPTGTSTTGGDPSK
ncbi:MAG TPA: hypothetical protein VGM12_23185 [Trebonia sp.]